MPKFSIIIPVRERVKDGKLRRCLNSVQAQAHDDFECIVVDDGSREDVAGLVSNYDIWCRYIRLEKPQGRVIARNVGMEAATGDWLLWLDSDDALDPMYLETVAWNIAQEPDARLWVLGVVVHGMVKADKRHVCPKWTKLRKAWMPPVNCDGGHSHFNSGHVGTGMFIFHHECLEKTGLMPPWLNHEQIADGVDEWLGYETGYSAAKKLCGNPYGGDWAMFRRLTQFYRVHLIDACLYIQYVR